MSEEMGFIKFPRRYRAFAKDVQTLGILTHLMLEAEIFPRQVDHYNTKIKLERGQIKTTYREIARAVGVEDWQQIKRLIAKFAKFQVLTITPIYHGFVFSMLDYPAIKEKEIIAEEPKKEAKPKRARKQPSEKAIPRKFQDDSKNPCSTRDSEARQFQDDSKSVSFPKSSRVKNLSINHNKGVASSVEDTEQVSFESAPKVAVPPDFQNVISIDFGKKTPPKIQTSEVETENPSGSKIQIPVITANASTEDELVLFVNSPRDYQNVLNNFLEFIEQAKNKLGFDYVSTMIDIQNSNTHKQTAHTSEANRIWEKILAEIPEFITAVNSTEKKKQTVHSNAHENSGRDVSFSLNDLAMEWQGHGTKTFQTCVYELSRYKTAIEQILNNTNYKIEDLFKILNFLKSGRDGLLSSNFVFPWCWFHKFSKKTNVNLLDATHAEMIFKNKRKWN